MAKKAKVKVEAVPVEREITNHGRYFIVQHGSDNLSPLVDIVAPWNHAFASRWNYAYILDQDTTVKTDPAWEKDHSLTGLMCPYFEKLRVIYELLMATADGAVVIFMDMDCIITRRNYDIFDWIRSWQGDICMRQESMWPINAGVIVVRNSEKTRTFFKACIAGGSVSDKLWQGTPSRGTCGWEERRLAVELGLFPDILKVEEPLSLWPLGLKYNCYHPTQEEYVFHAGAAGGSRSLEDKLHLIKMVQQDLPHR